MPRHGLLRKMTINVGPNMTPMVDIVLCILIFFMLMTSFAAKELFLTSNTAVDKTGLGTEVTNVKLPSARRNIQLKRSGGKTLCTAPGAPPTPDPRPSPVWMPIQLKRSGGKTWFTAAGAPPMPMDALDAPTQPNDAAIAQVLAAKKSKLSDDVQVIIIPDKDVPYQDVITVYDSCVKAQYKQVAFSPAQG